MGQEYKNGSFTRWQGRTIEELGKAINVIIKLVHSAATPTSKKSLLRKYSKRAGCEAPKQTF